MRDVHISVQPVRFFFVVVCLFFFSGLPLVGLWTFFGLVMLYWFCRKTQYEDKYFIVFNRS